MVTTQSAPVDFSKSEGPDLAGLPWGIYSSNILLILSPREDIVFPNLLFLLTEPTEKSWEQIHLCCLKIWSNKTSDSVLPCAGLAGIKGKGQAAFLT